jgi:hypothetical protein
VRRQNHALWSEVAEYNAEHGVPDDATRVTFYCGQVLADSVLPSDDTATKPEPDEPPGISRAARTTGSEQS